MGDQCLMRLTKKKDPYQGLYWGSVGVIGIQIKFRA